MASFCFDEVWVGERAFRASVLPAQLLQGWDRNVLLLLPVGSMLKRFPVLRSKAAAKEQIEGLGYSIKVYRTGELGVVCRHLSCQYVNVVWTLMGITARHRAALIL